MVVFTVTGPQESGAGSLRDVVHAANAADGADTIVFPSSTANRRTSSGRF
jgi:hypothetical protein